MADELHLSCRRVNHPYEVFCELEDVDRRRGVAFEHEDGAARTRGQEISGNHANLV